MLRSITTAAFALLMSTAIAQIDIGTAKIETGKPIGKKNEFGVEVTNFYGLINTEFESNNPYFVTYRRHFGNWALRAGAGGTLNNVAHQVNGIDTGKDVEMGVTISAGYERQIWFGNRWGFYYGADVTYSQGYNGQQVIIGDSSDVFTEVNTLSSGVALLAGFRFRLNKRLSLGTTASYWVGAVTERLDVNFKDWKRPHLNTSSNSRSDGFRGFFNEPYSIYVLFDF